MENKNKIEESLKRFKELISEDNLYGNLVNKELLNEGGGLSSIVDDIVADIVKQLKSKTNQTVIKDVLNQIESNAKKLFTNRLNLPSTKSTEGFQKYISGGLSNDLSLSNDLKKVFMNSIKGRNNTINNSEALKEAYVEIVNEYIAVFEKYAKDISNGHYTITSLQSKPEINRLLSLVDDGQGNTFYKRYEELFKDGPTSSAFVDMLPPKAQKMYGAINKKLEPLRMFLNIIKVKKDLPFIEDFTTIYNRLRNRTTITGKVWEALLVPFKMYTRNYWVAYFGLLFVKAKILKLYCDAQSSKGADNMVKENDSIIGYENKIMESTDGATSSDFFDGLGDLFLFLLTTYLSYFKNMGIDPAEVVPTFGLTDWRCGGIVDNFVEDVTSGLDDQEFLEKTFTTSDGMTMTGQELKDLITEKVNEFEISDFMKIKDDVENTYKQHLEDRLKNN